MEKTIVKNSSTKKIELLHEKIEQFRLKIELFGRQTEQFFCQKRTVLLSQNRTVPLQKGHYIETLFI